LLPESGCGLKFDQIVLPEASMQECVFSVRNDAIRAAERPGCRQASILGLTEFVINLKVYFDKVTATCPRCWQTDIQQNRENGENIENITAFGSDVTFSDNPDHVCIFLL
jgi:predicted Zn-ribbon and HTH transcriptional regulator